MSYYIVIITPAIKYLQIVIPACLLQTGEDGHPRIHWMPGLSFSPEIDGEIMKRRELHGSTRSFRAGA